MVFPCCIDGSGELEKSCVTILHGGMYVLMLALCVTVSKLGQSEFANANPDRLKAAGNLAYNG